MKLIFFLIFTSLFQLAKGEHRPQSSGKLYKITSKHNEKVPDFFKKIEEFASDNSDDSAMIRLLKL